MRVIIGVALGVITVCVFIAVTVVVFIVEHLFAVTLLAAVAVALFLRHRHRSRRTHFATHPPYPGALTQPPTRAAVPRFTAGGMSSAALRPLAPRSLPRHIGDGLHD
jgi:hypothetical protein